MNDRAQAARAAQGSERRGSVSLSRRGLLGAGAAGAALVATGRQVFAQAASTTTGGHARRHPHALLDLHFLVDRITQGFDATVWQEAQSLGYAGFLEAQLDPASIDDSAVAARLAPLSTLTMTSKQLWDIYGGTSLDAVPVSELKQAAVIRAVYSKRQLFERMVEFWTDHFNIDQADGENRLLKTADDRDVIRVHALGTFPDLLLASMRSGAMLYYLDNYSSKKEAPNENYARELLELHTLGVGNYTEFDIKEVARCLTGWSRWPTSAANYGDFRYVPSFHDDNAKSVLGTSIAANGGENDGLVVHSILATHPQTARFVGRKLCRWLLSYEPPESVVDAVAAEYLATGGDIQALIRLILSPSSVGPAHVDQFPKLRRPFHLVSSLLRAAQVNVVQPIQIVTQLGLLGHLPFGWSTPDGYPDSLEAWGDGLLPRWRFASRLCDNLIPGSQVDVATLFAGVPKSAIGARVNAILAGGRLDPEDELEVQLYVDSFQTLTDAVRREALALGASSPSYQYY